MIVPAHRQPEALPGRPDGEARTRPPQVGAGVPGQAGVVRRLHEPAARGHGGVHRGTVRGDARRGPDPVQQRAVREGHRFEEGGCDAGGIGEKWTEAWRRARPAPPSLAPRVDGWIVLVMLAINERRTDMGTEMPIPREMNMHQTTIYLA